MIDKSIVVLLTGLFFMFGFGIGILSVAPVEIRLDSEIKNVILKNNECYFEYKHAIVYKEKEECLQMMMD